MTTKSYIKIYGPPILKTIRELEKIAVDMPEVCIMNSIIAGISEENPVVFTDPKYILDYFSNVPATIEIKRCNTIISKSGEQLGEYDFFFEWFKDPTMDQLNQLIKKIDESLIHLGSKYTIITKK